MCELSTTSIRSIVPCGRGPCSISCSPRYLKFFPICPNCNHDHCVQIPINAYFAIQLAVSQFSQVDDLLYLFIIIFQIVGALNQLLPIANLARQAHKIDAYFVPIQAKLRSEALLSHKMKLMTHYEMLHSAQHKISYTIGPVCYVTYRTIGLVRTERGKCLPS